MIASATTAAVTPSDSRPMPPLAPVVAYSSTLPTSATTNAEAPRNTRRRSTTARSGRAVQGSIDQNPSSAATKSAAATSGAHASIVRGPRLSSTA
jgi:hypothetical protein